MEYALEEYEDGNGRKKQRPVKLGMAPIQRDGVEYEFTLVGDIDQEHRLVVTKSRIESLDGQVIVKPGEDLGQKISAWLNSGAEPTKKAEAVPAAGAPNRDVLARRFLAVNAALEKAGREKLVMAPGTPLARVEELIEEAERTLI
jgi:hypothetical protein